jgi:Protein of unknown function (DUF2742)
MSAIESQQVSWWSVHEFVQKYLDTAGHYPMAGTPAWCELANGDRRKWAGLLEFAQHHALRVETAQEQDAAASHDVRRVAAGRQTPNASAITMNGTPRAPGSSERRHDHPVRTGLSRRAVDRPRRPAYR